MTRREKAAATALALAAMGLPAWLIASTWTEPVALRRQWTIEGPACPVVAAPDRAVVGRRSPQFFVYQGVRFGRQFGDVSCVAPPARSPLDPKSYAVCQCPEPAMVKVVGPPNSLAPLYTERAGAMWSSRDDWT